MSALLPARQPRARPTELEVGLFHDGSQKDTQSYRFFVAPKNSFNNITSHEGHSKTSVLRVPRKWMAAVHSLLTDKHYKRFLANQGHPETPPFYFGHVIYLQEGTMPQGEKKALLQATFPKGGFYESGFNGPRAMGSWLLRKTLEHMKTNGFEYVRSQETGKLALEARNQLVKAGLLHGCYYSVDAWIAGMDKAIEKSMRKEIDRSTK